MKASLLRTRVTAEATFSVDEPEPVITGWERNREWWVRANYVFVYLHLEDEAWLWHHILVRGEYGWSDGHGHGSAGVDYRSELHTLPQWLADLVEVAIKALDDEAPRRDAVDREASDAPAD